MERATSPAGQHRPRLYSPDRLEGEQMPAQRLTMRRVRELLRLHYGMGVSARAIARELGVSRSAVQDYLARATAGGPDLAVGGRSHRRGARGAAVRGERRQAGGAPAGGAGLGRTGARDEATRGQSDGAVGGVRRRASRRLQLQPLLRALPRF